MRIDPRDYLVVPRVGIAVSTAALTFFVQVIAVGGESCSARSASSVAGRAGG
jgi:ABC-type transporter Mla maintaining outer membrane lipid asymmetry permease subunit MlaE